MEIFEHTAELWDLYTKDKEKTGRTHQRGLPMPENYYRLAIHVCIFNSKNQLLIQQRQPFKKGWPNMWDVTVGGSAVAGDSSTQAAERELFEELGLKLDLSGERPFLTMNFSGGFDDFYIIEQEIDLAGLRLQPEEVRQFLRDIRAAIRAALPEAEERIAWSMPTFWKQYNIIHFAASKNHVGLYPGPEAVREFAERLEGYKTSKGTIQLPYNRPVPVELISDLARWCYETGNHP